MCGFNWFNIRKKYSMFLSLETKANSDSCSSFSANWGCPIACLSVISGSIGEDPTFEHKTLNSKHGPPSPFFRIISPKYLTNDMLQSPWPWWNSVHFGASKLRGPRQLVWPIGEEGWTLPALTSPTSPPPNSAPQPPNTPPFTSCIHSAKQPVSGSGCQSVCLAVWMMFFGS